MSTRLTPKYITDEKGRKTAVILPLRQYDALLEDLHDLAMIAERREEPTINHKQAIARIMKGYGNAGEN